MKYVTLAAALAACALAATPAFGEGGKAAEKQQPAKEEPKHAEGSQQNRMKACNEEAAKKQLKGEERRAFMSSCLKTH